MTGGPTPRSPLACRRLSLRRALGGVANVGLARLLNWRAPRPAPALTLPAYQGLAVPTALDTARLLTGRGNRERARVLAAALDRQGLPVVRRPYRTVEGAGVSLFAELGGAGPVLLLAAHHDAVPGSPGANDNAAAVGILVALGRRLQADPPRRIRVRLAFFGGEERGMLGARVHVRRAGLAELLGVMSLELCGIGDSLVLWDVTPPVAATPLVTAWIAAAEGLGLRRDLTYHLAEPVPLFGSDHRPFVDRGVPGCGLTAVPTGAIEPLRAFVYGAPRTLLAPPARRPVPFATYHTAADGPDTLEAPALSRVERVLEGLVQVLDGRT